MQINTTQPFLTRSFDHAGYYETRLILAVLGLALAIYYWRRDRDRQFLTMFAVGIFFQALLERSLAASGLRGPNYSLSVFGVSLTGVPQYLFQGAAEGGILALSAYLFVDLIAHPDKRRARARIYLAWCVLVVVLASITGSLAAGQPITSPRPMLNPGSIWSIPMYVCGSLLLMWIKGRDAFHYFGLFAAGLLLYVILTFEPLHLYGARYVSFRDAAGQFSPAPGWEQWRWIFYSHSWEVTAAKMYYFAIPYFLRLISLPERYR